MNAWHFKNARVFREWEFHDEDVFVDGGTIVSKVANATTVDLEGKYLLPGLVDVHVHFRDGHLSGKETYASGAKAAMAGGVTTCFVMANGSPVCDTPEKVDTFNELTSTLPVRLLPVGAVTQNLEGKKLVDFKRMLDAGCVAFSDDGHTIMDTQVLNEALQWSGTLGFVLILHEEDRFLSPVTGMNASPTALKLGLPSSHEVAESSLTARDCELKTVVAPEARVHIAHVSSPRTLDIVRQHFEENVSWEVTPHHLFFDDTKVGDRLGFAKMSPPLRSKETRQALWDGLMEESTAICATDHAPHTVVEKEQTFGDCPCGVVGVETALSSMFTLCQGSEEKFARVVASMSTVPALRFGLDLGAIEEGYPADFCIFDPKVEWRVDPAQFHSKAKHSPWEGTVLQGKVSQTWVAGCKVFES